MNARTKRRIMRARVMESRHGPAPAEDIHPACGAEVAHMEKRPAEQATIPPIDAPPWVSIRVIGTAGFTVECSRCGAVMWLYQVTASSKPGALQAVVDEHALCVARAA